MKRVPGRVVVNMPAFFCGNSNTSELLMYLQQHHCGLRRSWCEPSESQHSLQRNKESRGLGCDSTRAHVLEVPSSADRRMLQHRPRR